MNDNPGDRSSQERLKEETAEGDGSMLARQGDGHEGADALQ